MSNLNNTYSVAKANEQLTTKSIKSAVIPEGKTLVFAGIVEGKAIDGKANDTVLYTLEGTPIAISVREYLKFKTSDESSLMNNEDSDMISFAPKFTVSKSSDREYQGEKAYPLQHYKLTSEMLSDKAGTPEFDYAVLVEGGFKPESKQGIADGKIDAVQDYVIEL